LSRIRGGPARHEWPEITRILGVNAIYQEGWAVDGRISMKGSLRL